MRKILLSLSLSATFMYTSSAYALSASICGQAAYIKIGDQNLYEAEYCTRPYDEEDNNERTTHHASEPTDKLKALVPGMDAEEYFQAERSWVGRCDKVCEKDLQEKFTNAVTAFNAGIKLPSQARTLQEIQQGSATLAMRQEELNSKKSTISKSYDVSESTPKTKEKFLSDNHINGVSVKDGEFVCEDDPDKEKCFTITANYSSYQAKQIQNIKKNIKDAKKLQQQNEDQAKKLLSDLDTFYKDGFEKNAKEQLNKKDSSIKPNDPKTLSEICSVRFAKSSPSDIDKEVQKACEVLKKDGEEVVGPVYDRLQDLKREIGDSGDDLEFLNLKLDLDKLNNDQKMIALASIQDDVKGKLKNTLLGHMMDQMRADMCNVAQHPKIMCQNVPYVLEKNVDDSSGIVEKAAEQFKSRIISGGSATVKEGN